MMCGFRRSFEGLFVVERMIADDFGNDFSVFFFLSEIFFFFSLLLTNATNE